jgi:hypothetical protein
MQKTQVLNQKQREEFKDTLREVYRKAERALSEKSTEAHRTALQKLLEHQGAVELATTYKTLKAKLDETEKQLGLKGFDIRHDDVELDSYGASDEVKAIYETFVAEQIGPEKQRVEELSEAVRSSWSIATLSEAKELLASFTQ